MPGRGQIVAFALLLLTLLLGALNPEIPHARLQSPKTVIQLIGGVPSTTIPAHGPPADNSTPWSPLVTALIWITWIGSIASIIALFTRFYSKHNEHPAYDDHPAPEIYARGLNNYIRLTRKDKDEQEQDGNSP